MVIITNYSDTYLKINKDESDIFFLAKDGLQVSARAGSIILTSSSTSYTYVFTDIKSPKLTTPDEMVVAIRQYIDNV
jgi:hypothetical protein